MNMEIYREYGDTRLSFWHDVLVLTSFQLEILEISQYLKLSND